MSFNAKWTKNTDDTVRIINGRCAEVMAQLPANSIDCAITSPPYYQQRSYENGGHGQEDTLQQYIGRLLTDLREVKRVVKRTGSIIYNVGDKYRDGSLLLVPYKFAAQATADEQLTLINQITWVKTNPVPHQYGRRLINATEPFFHFVQSKDYYYDRNGFGDRSGIGKKTPHAGPKLGEKYRKLLESGQGHLTLRQRQSALKALEDVVREVHCGAIAGFRMKIRGVHAPAYGGQGGGRQDQMKNNGFTIIRMSGEPMKRDVMMHHVESRTNGHPAVFPCELIRQLVRMTTPLGGSVLDPYMGSGSTLIAALSEGRTGIGIDISKKYCEESRERIAKGMKGGI